jgi:hypothetical protein
MSSRVVSLWALAFVSIWGAARSTQAYSLLPLVTEEAQTLPSGVIEATLGVNYFHNLRYPPFTPPGVISSQTLMGLPQVAFRIGAGDWAEFQASYEMLYLDETDVNGRTNHQYGGGDARIFTKIWFARERTWRPAIGLHVGTKLPNATRGSRLGTDDTDFAAAALLSKTFGPVTALTNLGILLLGNSGPSVGNSFEAGGQDDLFTYTVGLASKPLGAVAEGAVTARLLGEIAGQTGSRFDNDLSDIRFGLQLQRGGATLYAGVSTGLVSAAEQIGASIGFTYAFDSAKLWELDE